MNQKQYFCAHIQSYMKIILLFVFSLASLWVNAQEINLQQLQETIAIPGNNNYKDVLAEKGFEMVSDEKEGQEGFYQLWVQKDTHLQLIVQHNPVFRFTKLVLTSTAESSKKIIAHLYDEIRTEYNRIIEDEKTYFFDEENPNTTVHVISQAQNDFLAQGIMLFRKY